jgi:RHS repeat-associated protein
MSSFSNVVVRRMNRSRRSLRTVSFSAVVAATILLGAPSANALNFQVPSGTSGTLVLEKISSESKSGWPAEFGLVQRNAAGEPTYIPLTITDNTSDESPFYRVPVKGGEVFEFYLTRNVHNDDPELVPETFSTDPTKNSPIDPAAPEHFEADPFTGGWNVFFEGFNSEYDTNAMWENAETADYFTFLIEPTCGGSVPCPDPNAATSNHNVAPSVAGRNTFNGVQNVTAAASKVGPIIGLVRNFDSKAQHICVNARIDNLTWSFAQEGVDFTTYNHDQVAGCGGDDEAFSTAHDLKRIEVKRYHRPKYDYITHSTFGVGVFAEWDVNLTIYPPVSGQPTTAVLFDPRVDAPPLTFYEQSAVDNDSAIDGLLHDRESRSYKSLVLLDASNNQTADPFAAQTALLTKLNGESYLFEIINTEGGTNPSSLSARLSYMADRNDNTYGVDYLFQASATDAELGYDRSLLWEAADVGDMYGSYVYLQYPTVPAGARHEVTSITYSDPNNPQNVPLQYKYSVADASGTEPDRLIQVTYPDGAKSVFSRAWDSASQLWKEHFNDVAIAGNGRYVVDAYFTGTSFSGSDGLVYNQAEGMVRKVINANGERVYQNWEDPSQPGVTYYVQGTGGAGTRLTRLTTNPSGALLQVAHAQTYNASPTAATYIVDETYAPTATGLFGSFTNALNQVTTAVRDALSGAITGLKTADGKSTTTTLDAKGRVTSQVDALGYTTTMLYDPLGNLVAVTTASGTPHAETWSYSYNDSGLMKSVRSPLGVEYDFNYSNPPHEAPGQLLTVFEPADTSTGTRPTRTYEYDTLNRRIAETDEAGRRTTFFYDVRGRLYDTQYPDGTSDENVFPAPGTGPCEHVQIGKFDRNNVITNSSYDATCRQTAVSSQQSTSGPSTPHVTRYEYFPGRYILSATTVDGGRTESTFDTKDREINKVVYVTNTATLTYQKTWDAADRLLTETDSYNRKTYYVYDAVGRMLRRATELVPSGISSTANIATLARSTAANPAFLIEDHTYDNAGNALSITNGRNYVTSYTYDEQSRPNKMIEAAGTPNAATTTYTYDLDNNLLSQVGPRSTTTYTYTLRDLQDSKTVASGSSQAVTVHRTYRPTGTLATETDGLGGKTTFTYAANDERMATVTDPLGGVSSITYDAVGHPLTQTDQNGVTISSTYDSRYRRLKDLDGLGQATSYVYDDNLTDGVGLDSTYSSVVSGLGFGSKCLGHAIQVTSPGGSTRLVVLDCLGRKILEEDSFGGLTKTKYDVMTNGLAEIAVTNTVGKTRKIRQDTGGHIREQVDEDGNTTKTSFDANGNAISTRDPNNVGADCTFNERDQKTSCKNTLNETVSWTLDADGNVTKETDALGNSTTCQYDLFGRKTSCVDRLGLSRSYTWDANSNLLSVKDAQSGTTTFAYDARNHGTGTTYPDASTDKITNTYDAGERLLTTTDQSGNKLTMSYDKLNRLTQITYPDNLNDTFAYDTDSHLVSATSGRYGVTTSRAYDVEGHMSSETTTAGGHSYKVSVGYDQQSRVKTITYPDGTQTTNTYGLGRDLVTNVARGSASIVTYGYDSGSRVNKTTFGNGLVETPTYQSSGPSVTQLSTTTVGTLTYSYDKNHNKLTFGGTAASGNQTFGYDKEDRVTAWSGTSLTQSWVLSGEGDWTSTTRNGTAEARTYNTAHELTAVAGKALTYDARGNVTQNDQGDKVTWDISNRLKQYQKSGGATVGYLYDALGRRVGRTLGSSTTIYVPVADQFVAEYKDNVLQTDYIYGPGMDNVVAYVNGGHTYYYSKDPTNSVVAITNDSAAVSERYRYTASGERTILSPSGTALTATTVANSIGFTGRPHDVDTGVIDFRSRVYDARLGRFLGRDSDGYPDGLNSYRGYFAPNNTDPTGHNVLGDIYHGAVNGAADLGHDAVGGAEAIGKATVGGAEALGNAVAGGTEALGNAAVGGLKDLGDAANDAIGVLGQGANNILGLAGDLGQQAWDGSRYLGTELWAGTRFIGDSLWSGTKYLASEAWKGTKVFAHGLWRFAGEVVSDTWDNFKIICSQTWNLCKSFWGLYKDLGLMFYDFVTLHPVDALKKLVAAYGNLDIAAFNASLAVTCMVGGYNDPLGGPTTTLGIVIGLVGWARGGDTPEIHWHNGGLVFEFKNSPFRPAGAAFTLGRAIVAGKNADITHELQHVTQYGILGETFLPWQLTAQGVSLTLTDDWSQKNSRDYAKYNPFEWGPYDHHPWPTVPKIPW